MDVEVRQTQKEAKCKFCEEVIDRGEWCVVFENVHVSPKIVNLFFHTHCFERLYGDYVNDLNEIGIAPIKPPEGKIFKLKLS